MGRAEWGVGGMGSSGVDNEGRGMVEGRGWRGGKWRGGRGWGGCGD